MLDEGQAIADHVRNWGQQILDMFPVTRFGPRIQFFEIREPVNAGVFISHGGAEKGPYVTVRRRSVKKNRAQLITGLFEFVQCLIKHLHAIAQRVLLLGVQFLIGEVGPDPDSGGLDVIEGSIDGEFENGVVAEVDVGEGHGG